MTRRTARTRRRPPGLSLVEATLASVMVGVLIVAALNALGSAASLRRTADERTRATLLASDLMDEILAQPLDENDDTGGSVLGIDLGGLLGGLGAVLTGEVDAGNTRAEFDDIFDYDRWSSSPPQSVTGDKLTWAAGFERSVLVSWVRSDAPDTAGADDSGLARIVVQVRRDGRPITRLIAFRSTDWSGRLPNPETTQ